ncbi:UNVERIFIED_CONTAM: Pectinesterase 2 [Sesamum latifolium]|uniref:Pectinesterase n=1 Tax=Sesamum latifolium TaxID=2727402 RepID=A0AAW2T970_9LAMI
MQAYSDANKFENFNKNTNEQVSLNMAVDAAMSRALETLNRIKLLGLKSQNPKNVQTWLSAALTNLDNCKTSITELNVRNSVVSEFLSADVLISKQAISAEIMKNALDAASKRRNSSRIVIHIKQGKYQEYLEISSNMKKVQRAAKPWHCSRVRTSQPSIDAPSKDTRIHSGLVQIRECHIYGTIEWAAVVIQNSFIYARKPKRGQSVVITAQGRTDPNQKTGISIINCKVEAGPDLRPVLSQYKAYLGRPWMKYSRTIYFKSFLGSLINPLGWMDWNTDYSKENTVYYGEYGNYGPGSSTKGRVKWPGYRVITSAAEAKKFSVAKFIDGKAWLPQTGVPFSAGLSV